MDITRAEDLLKNIFVFDEYLDMEPCVKRVRNDPVDWYYTPYEDDEWTYMLNRFTYLFHLSACFLKTKNKKYIEKGKELILDWIEKVPLVPSKATRTLDTGIRMYSFMKFFKDHPEIFEKREVELLWNSLKEQLFYLKDHYLSKYNGSNWGLIQYVSISIYYLSRKEKKAYQQSIKKLRSLLKTQLLEDGMYWEKSMTYHQEVLKWLLILAKEQKDHKVTITFQKEITQMMQTSLTTADFKGFQMMLGDSDQTDIRPLYQMYQTLFSKTLNSQSKKLYSLNNINIENRKESILQFYNTPMASSHVHLSPLHFNYYRKKRCVIQDAGRYTYRESKERRYLKSMAAHNGPRFEKDPYPITGSWEYGGYPQVQPIFTKSCSHHTYVESSYYGEEVMKRSIFYLANDDLVIIDECRLKGTHELIVDYNLFYPIKIFGNADVQKTKRLISRKYNEKELVNGLRLTKRFTDYGVMCHVLTFTPERYAFGEILQKDHPVSDDLATVITYHHEKTSYTICKFHREIYQGEKVFHLKDQPIYGRAFIKEGKKIHRFR